MDYLEHLAKRLGCSYLSDLRYRSVTEEEARQLIAEADVFPLAGYVDAARYILSRDVTFSTGIDARHAIADYLRSLGQ